MPLLSHADPPCPFASSGADKRWSPVSLAWSPRPPLPNQLIERFNGCLPGYEGDEYDRELFFGCVMGILM
ncbi:hypothetical protein U9M48_025320 [Paspalum notatum var. saurae]|uniref:Uncharacterized protein n=1 Tax=Paspalum notatum var. saurae TaxID=547442 RepID=A0AAQ3WX66_PASNO